MLVMELFPLRTTVPMKGGASGSQSPPTGTPSPKMVRRGPRERQIVDLISRGRTDKAIAVELGMSVRTVRTHLERLYRKRCLHCRAEAVALWLQGEM